MKSKIMILFIMLFSILYFNNLSASANSSSNDFYYNDYGFSHFTRYNLAHIQDESSKGNLAPDFSKIKIYDLFSAKDDRDKTKGQLMNVWDSWPLQDSNGNVVDYKGYHLTFALSGNSNRNFTSKYYQGVQDSRIFLYYQKIGQEKLGVKSWHNAGPVFKTPTEGVKGKDATLNEQIAQWSGNTVMLPNHKIRMFYTTYNGTNDNNWQSIATARLKLMVRHNKVYIDHKKTSDNKTILRPDGKYYQKNSQIEKNVNDENMFRDPHFFVYKGKNYITFSANSGPKSGPEGEDILRNKAYLGGDRSFINKEYSSFYSNNNINSFGKKVSINNAVIGVAELNKNFTLKRFVKPILGLNAVTDEFERPDLFEHNGKWYLFGVTRGYKLATVNLDSLMNSFMLGFVGKTPFGPFKPLNNNGLIIKNTQPWNSRYYTYSFYVLNGKKNRLLVTSYMTNPQSTKYHTTFAPTMILNLNGNKTNVSDELLPQGATVAKNLKN